MKTKFLDKHYIPEEIQKGDETALYFGIGFVVLIEISVWFFLIIKLSLG